MPQSTKQAEVWEAATLGRHPVSRSGAGMDKQEEKVELVSSSDDRTLLSGPVNRNLSMPQSPSPGDFSGNIIAERYEMLGQIGTGGMSTVYKVRHIHLDKMYALKILHHMSDEAISRFQQEAKTSTLLEHPNIVRVHDFGVTADGRPYMVMDYLEGKSLQDFIRSSGKLEPALAIKLFTQIANALQTAHDKGVVHRDIKPTNIMIKELEDGPSAVVLDFGIAKMMDPEGKQAQNLTRTGDIFGTPLYMSPEQCQGLTVDARSDIYSLGCVLYEALTGQIAFEGDSVYHTIYKQINEAPPPFPRSLSGTRTGKMLEALVTKALAKAPSNRQRFMLELASDLRQAEVASESFAGELMAGWRLLSGRLNAVERTTVVLNSSIRALSVVAVMLSIVLFSMPSKIVEARLEMNRNFMIKHEVSRAIESHLKPNKDEVLLPDKKVMDDSGTRLKALCKYDKQELAIMKRLDEAFAKANKSSMGIQTAIIDSFSLTGLGPGMFTGVRTQITNTIRYWADTSMVSTELISLAYSKAVRAREQLRSYIIILEVSKWGGILVCLGLFLVTLRSLQEQRKRRSENLSS